MPVKTPTLEELGRIASRYGLSVTQDDLRGKNIGRLAHVQVERVSHLGDRRCVLWVSPIVRRMDVWIY